MIMVYIYIRQSTARAESGIRNIFFFISKKTSFTIRKIIDLFQPHQFILAIKISKQKFVETTVLLNYFPSMKTTIF